MSLFSELIRKVVHKIYLYKKQDHLGNRNKMRRVPGISISTVKLQDARRQNNVTKLIEMFEKKHRHKKQFLKDTSQKQEINRFSEESQQFLVDMNSTDNLRTLRELCKTSMS